MSRRPDRSSQAGRGRNGPSRHRGGGAGRAPRDTDVKPPTRLQKLLADAGIASRREIERWIEAGRIRVNGQVARLGDKARPTDAISVDSRPVKLSRHFTPARVIAYHKPAGEVSTRNDPEGRPTVFEHLPRAGRGRWISVGRLDANTSGLLLFTTDGELASRLMHPSTEMEREYAVRVLGEVNEEQMALLRSGVELEDGPAAFDSVVPAGASGANRWYSVVLHEGRNREVRRLFEAIGCVVSRLIRTRYGPIALDRRLARGRWQEIQGDSLAALYAGAGLPLPEEIAERMRRRFAGSRSAGNRNRRHAAKDKRGPAPDRSRQSAPHRNR